MAIINSFSFLLFSVNSVRNFINYNNSEVHLPSRMTNYEIFNRLHHQHEPLLLGNAWNAYSAQLFEKNGYKAIGTSSAAVAISLGFEDGEKISFDDLFFVVKKIIAGINIPLSVDMEGGYGNDMETIIGNIEKLYQAGVVGINIEDSTLVKDKQEMIPVDVFSKKLNKIKNHLSRNNMKMYINARTDAFLLKLLSDIEITLERAKAYENAGADGIFVPFIIDADSIKKVTAATSLPVNVLSTPGLPSFDKLTELGVRRISMGSSLFRSAYGHIETLMKNIIRRKTFSPLF
jgi:2-methylisocitrate lyase-like PEP mutase family enzyme